MHNEKKKDVIFGKSRKINLENLENKTTLMSPDFVGTNENLSILN